MDIYILTWIKCILLLVQFQHWRPSTAGITPTNTSYKPTSKYPNYSLNAWILISLTSTVFFLVALRHYCFIHLPPMQQMGWKRVIYAEIRDCLRIKNSFFLKATHFISWGEIQTRSFNPFLICRPLLHSCLKLDFNLNICASLLCLINFLYHESFLHILE